MNEFIELKTVQGVLQILLLHYYRGKTIFTNNYFLKIDLIANQVSKQRKGWVYGIFY